MHAVIVLISFTTFEATLDTVHTEISLVPLSSWAKGWKANIFEELDRPTHVDNNKLVFTRMGGPYAEVKPNVVAMGVDVVLDEEIVESCFFAFEDAV